MSKPHYPNLKPSRIVAVIKDALTPGIQFEQATKSGDRWILLWSPGSDRLYRWDVPSGGTWKEIKSTAVSTAKKEELRKV